jgi:cytochrome c oxidase subunit 2
MTPIAALLLSEHDALGPAGPQSGRIAELFWVFFWISVIVWTAVVAFAILGSLRKRPAGESALRRNVIGATAVTTLILLGLLIASIVTGSAVANAPGGKPMDLDVVAHQWWWEVHYPDAIASRTVVTANEIHIPTGRPVRIQLSSHDVIHSFWVPSLHGKTDLIPTRLNYIWIRADRPGVYRGQCAEFCGLQHAHMLLYVIAEPEPRFEAWKNQQLAPAAEPATPSQQRGREVFLNGPCILCHAIRGTSAFASAAPDLTHLASRGSIAAGTLANKRGDLSGWITDAQHIKPGSYMPSLNIPAADVQPLTEYLESLK